MPYRVLAPLVIAKDRRGALNYHYQVPVIGSSGPIIPWLDDVQREHFLSHGLVEEIPDESPVSDGSVACDNSDGLAVSRCAAAMQRLGLVRECGAPRAREELRAAGYRFGNGTIAAALRLRKTFSDDEDADETNGTTAEYD